MGGGRLRGPAGCGGTEQRWGGLRGYNQAAPGSLPAEGQVPAEVGSRGRWAPEAGGWQDWDQRHGHQERK